MAILLDKTLPTGITAGYWVIQEIDINLIADTATITVGLYADSDAIGKGFAPLLTNAYVLQQISILAPSFTDVVNLAYAAIEINPDFEGCTDDGVLPAFAAPAANAESPDTGLQDQLSQQVATIQTGQSNRLKPGGQIASPAQS